MCLLFFPFFFGYLLLSLGISFLRILTDLLGFISSLLLTVGFFLLIVCLYTLRTDRTPPLFARSPILGETPQPIEQYINYWETIKNLQPTHRDILLNLAALYEYAGDATKSAEMEEAAQQVDPNYFD
jgi:hypothetical protein